MSSQGVRRRQKVLEIVNSERAASVADLAEMLEVSDMTVRRDLALLASQSLLRRVYGGAVKAEPDPPHATRSSSPLGHRPPQARPHSRRRAVSLAVSAGTSCEKVAAALARMPRVSIVTNSLDVADLVAASGVTTQPVAVTGGSPNARRALTGPMAVSSVRSFSYDYALIHADGVDAAVGVTVDDPDEAQVCQEMSDRAQRTVVLCEAGSWGRRSTAVVWPLGHTSTVVTVGDPCATANRLLHLIGEASRAVDLPEQESLHDHG